MEVVMLMIGFVLGVLIVPPTIAGGLQRRLRRKVGQLVKGSKSEEGQR
jgi:hypothetical protein